MLNFDKFAKLLSHYIKVRGIDNVWVSQTNRGVEHDHIESDAETWFEWDVSTNDTTTDLANAVAVESGKVTSPPLSTSTIGTFQLQFTPIATSLANLSL